MKLSILSSLPLLAFPLAAIAAPSPNMAGLVGWAADKLVSDGEMRTMDSWRYVDCGSASDVIQLKSLTVKPDPPRPGETLEITAKADVLETIKDGAYADVVVKLGLIKLLQKQFDVCEEAVNANATVQCPVAPGSYEVVQSVELPKEIPHAKFQVQLRGFNYDDADMICADIFIDFMKGRPGSA